MAILFVELMPVTSPARTSTAVVISYSLHLERHPLLALLVAGADLRLAGRHTSPIPAVFRQLRISLRIHQHGRTLPATA